MRKLIWVAVALASFSGLVAMAQVMVPAPGPGMPPGYGGYTPMMPPSAPYGYPPGGMLPPPPPGMAPPALMPFGTMPMPAAPQPKPGLPGLPPVPGQPAPPNPGVGGVPTAPAAPTPPPPPSPDLPDVDKTLPDVPAPPPGFLPSPPPPIQHAPPKPPLASEPYSVYEGIATGPGPLTEPTAVYEGPRYDSATRNDNYHSWIQVGFLHLWVRPDSVPPLVTAGPGPLTTPGTSVALGGNIGPNEFSGGTATLGWWIDREHTTSFEVTGFLLGQHSMSYVSDSTVAGGMLSIPVVANGVDTDSIVGAPGFSNGTVYVSDSLSMWGAEANIFQNCVRYQAFSCDFLFGFRYLYLQDALSIDQTLNSQGGLTFNGAAVPVGSNVFISDAFTTINQFYGGQLGARFALTYGPIEVTTVTKLAMGSTVSSTNIVGNSSVPDLAMSTNTGLFAQTTNMGKSYATDFAVVPEVIGTLSAQLSPNVRVLAGYQYLYWSRLERAGDQIDRNINAGAPAVNTIVGTGGTGPVQQNSHTHFWAHGFNVGIEFRY